jgi:hypothetical protein
MDRCAEITKASAAQSGSAQTIAAEATARSDGYEKPENEYHQKNS